MKAPATLEMSLDSLEDHWNRGLLTVVKMFYSVSADYQNGVRRLFMFERPSQANIFSPILFDSSCLRMFESRVSRFGAPLARLSVDLHNVEP